MADKQAPQARRTLLRAGERIAAADRSFVGFELWRPPRRGRHLGAGCSPPAALVERLRAAPAPPARRGDVAQVAVGRRERSVAELLLDDVDRRPSAASSAACATRTPWGWTRFSTPARVARRGGAGGHRKSRGARRPRCRRPEASSRAQGRGADRASARGARRRPSPCLPSAAGRPCRGGPRACPELGRSLWGGGRGPPRCAGRRGRDGDQRPVAGAVGAREEQARRRARTSSGERSSAGRRRSLLAGVRLTGRDASSGTHRQPRPGESPVVRRAARRGYRAAR